MAAKSSRLIDLRTIDCGKLLDNCYKLIQEARQKANYDFYNPDHPIHIVLPVVESRALYYYLSANIQKMIAVTGTVAPDFKIMFGAIWVTSEIIEEPIVY